MKFIVKTSPNPCTPKNDWFERLNKARAIAIGLNASNEEFADPLTFETKAVKIDDPAIPNLVSFPIQFGAFISIMLFIPVFPFNSKKLINRISKINTMYKTEIIVIDCFIFFK